MLKRRELSVARSEGVADGQVEAEALLEGGEVEIAAFAGVVGRMQTYAEVAAQHEHGDVDTQTHAGA